MIARPDPDIWFRIAGSSVVNNYEDPGTLVSTSTLSYDEAPTGIDLVYPKSEWHVLTAPSGVILQAINNYGATTGSWTETDQNGEFSIHGHPVPVRVTWDRAVYDLSNAEVSRAEETFLLTPASPAQAYTLDFPDPGTSCRIENVVIRAACIAGY